MFISAMISIFSSLQLSNYVKIMVMVDGNGKNNKPAGIGRIKLTGKVDLARTVCFIFWMCYSSQIFWLTLSELWNLIIIKVMKNVLVLTHSKEHKIFIGTNRVTKHTFLNFLSNSMQMLGNEDMPRYSWFPRAFTRRQLTTFKLLAAGATYTLIPCQKVHVMLYREVSMLNQCYTSDKPMIIKWEMTNSMIWIMSSCINKHTVVEY